MKAMILAAGFGKRLRPFTLTTPKPLLSVQGETLLDRHLHSLSAAGVTEVWINVAHLGEQIVQHVGDGSRYNLQVTISQEPKNAPLETGGAVEAVLPWFNDQPFILLAADIWTDFCWRHLLLPATRINADTMAHLVLVPVPKWLSSPDFCWNPESHKVSLPGDEQAGYGYSGFGIFHPVMWRGFSSGRFPISQVLRTALAKDRVMGSVYSGPWFNIGCSERLRELTDFLSLSVRS